MLKGFWKLTWVEVKIFAREPMGLFGNLAIPVIVFLLLGRAFSGGQDAAAVAPGQSARPVIIASILIALSAVSSLATIISIYREGGILKRLRATPLRPVTILGAHVVVKLIFTLVAFALLLLAGKRFYPAAFEVNLLSFAAALLVSTLSIVSIGFVIASAVPTARFARPIASAVLLPMFAVSGIFVPVGALPSSWRILVGALPMTRAVSLMTGIWNGAAWSQHAMDVAALALNFVFCCALSAKIFRWE